MSFDDSSSTLVEPATDADSHTGSSTPPSESLLLADELPDGDGENKEPTPDPEPEPEPDPVQIAADAEKLKEQGNESFKCGRYGEAIDLYTKAIGLSPPIPPLPLKGELSDMLTGHPKTWSLPNPHTSRTARLPTSPSNVSALPLPTADTQHPSKRRPRARPHPPKPSYDSRAANSRLHRQRRRSRRCAAYSRRNRAARPRCRCRRRRSRSRRTCVISRRRDGAENGAWHASRSSGVCRLLRRMRARSRQSGACGESRSSSRAGTGMARTALPSASPV